MTARTGTRTPPGALDLPELETNLDDQNPWPGLEGYQEGDESFFKGRSEEIEDLYRLIRRERLTLLYGKAGTGKTSLVRAGLFPKQRREEALPVWIRLDYSEGAPKLGAQVKSAVYAAAKESELEAKPPEETDSLWEYLHLRNGEFWSRHHRIIMPFLVFDQFEELFTHGLVQQDERRIADIRAFISQLSDLAEDRVPATLHEDRERIAACNLERHHYKLVVCMREEYLAELDRMRDDLPPALFHNRMRLTDLTEEKAKEVVQQTGMAVGAAPLAGEIVERASKDTQEQGRETELGIPKSAVNPAMLAVLCTMLNQKRQEEGAAKISPSHLDGIGKNILNEFYERQLESLPEIPGEEALGPGRTRGQEVNDRIGKEFVDGDVRVSIPPSRARTLLGDAALAALIADKVLGYTPYGRVELLHDVLPRVVEQTGDTFQRDWIDALRDSARWARRVAAGAGAAAVGAGLLALWAMGQAAGSVDPDAPIDNPDIDPFVLPPFEGTPTTRGGAVAITDTIVLDLNEGTRQLYAIVDQLGTEGRFQEAGMTLGMLSPFLGERVERFCVPAPRDTWHRAEVDLVLRHTCAAFRAQTDQWRTLQELFLGGEDALVDPSEKERVIGAWPGLERDFNRHKEAIQGIRSVWNDEPQAGS